MSLSRYLPVVLVEEDVFDLITLLIVFVCSQHYITNPYLLAKLVEVMFVLNPNIQKHTEHINNLLLEHTLALDHLVPALMKFYTGKHGNKMIGSKLAPQISNMNSRFHSEAKLPLAM